MREREREKERKRKKGVFVRTDMPMIKYAREYILLFLKTIIIHTRIIFVEELFIIYRTSYSYYTV